MSETWVEQATQFGGEWTVHKLNILECYLDAYTTALKKQPFDLVYIDRGLYTRVPKNAGFLA